MATPYRLEHGKVQNTFCEIQVAEHCNLACRSCSHLSPLMPRRVRRPGNVSRDLMSLAACYRVESLKLLGGEPLLHSGLLDVINAVVEAGISDKVCVVTNGVLLPRMKDEFWGAVDEVWIQLPGIRTLTRTA